ncbi:hypothetical protein ACFV2X_54445 [Streptomyces sp. NPDC059679]|uniref:hypothetical protein n=1 Tax=Streptomyces sp. NPDC059679 TaxID=3346903 RepID=UPI0036AFCE94
MKLTIDLRAGGRRAISDNCYGGGFFFKLEEMFYRGEFGPSDGIERWRDSSAA